MAFNSYSYLLFLAIAVFIFWQLDKSWRRPYLLLVSLAYYGSWNLAFVALPVALSILVYVLSRLIVSGAEPNKRWMRLGIVLVLIVLGFFKYREFLLGSLNALTTELALPPLTTPWAIALPLGISFYSFECISYLIDTSQGRVARRNLLDLCDFVCFWPHLMAGPIVRVRELIPQFRFDKGFDLRLFVVGLDRFIWGLVQKNMLADSLSTWVDKGFEVGRTVSTLDGWFLAAAFGLQIYFDFAGYTNMAIGASQLLGIKLPENFRYPYHALNPADFWSRWHMTLTRWIRDYLFFPVTTRYRERPAALYFSLIAVMAVVGLWHGAGWGFVAWGTLHGCFMVLYRIFERLQEGRWKRLATAHFWPAFTLVGVTAIWIPFRAENLPQAWGIWKSMFFEFSWGASFSPWFYQVTILIVLFSAIEPYLMSTLKKLDSAAWEGRRLPSPVLVTIRSLTYCCGLLLFVLLSQRDVQFIYFQF